MRRSDVGPIVLIFHFALACAPVEPFSQAERPRISTVPTAKQPPPAAVVPEPSTRAAPVGSRACGPLQCQTFESAEQAFDFVLAQSPRVLGIGETHAQKGTEGTLSATERFTEQLLPRLKGRASDLVIELWLQAGNCGEVEREVAERQKPITEPQSASNQQHFVQLGFRAKELGIQPHALVPTCDQYREIAGAGASDIDRMLEMIAEATARDIGRLLEAPRDGGPNLVRRRAPQRHRATRRA